MSLSGYWNVMVESADIEWGSSWTTSRPTPGAEEDGGKGEFMLRAVVDMFSSQRRVEKGKDVQQW